MGDLMVGRWTAKVKLVADWPGLKEKKGDNLTGCAEFIWTADRHALEGQEIVGPGIAKYTYAWDATSNKIKFFRANSGGMVSDGVVWKKSKWRPYLLAGSQNIHTHQ